MSILVAAHLIRGPAAVLLIGLKFDSWGGARISFLFKCCVLSGRGLCNGPIPFPVEYCQDSIYVCVSLRVIKGRNTSAPKVSKL
jgi:hypothetical protein